MDKAKISEKELEAALKIMQRLSDYYASKMVGQQSLKTALLITILSGGHLLLESVPGLAKTTAAKVMTEGIGAKFSRIQCTPDLLPSDIIGTQVYNNMTRTFETQLGPVYANFVLLDEVNRSSAKTQSAMLEAMQERQTSIGGKVYPMPDIFIVIATQNPVEQEGTYLLAEAQLDRFLIKEILDYPSPDEEVEVLNRIEGEVFEKGEAVVSLEDVKFAQKVSARVYIDMAVKKYIVNLIDATRHAAKYIGEDYAKYINLGSSTRGAVALMSAAKAFALLSGRTYVTPDDVKAVRHFVLRHRISLSFAAVADEVKVETIIDAIFGAVPAP